MKINPISIFFLLLIQFNLIHSIQPCRFAFKFSDNDLLSSEDKRNEYLSTVAYWESQFHKDGVGFNQANGLTYDGHAINYNTGEIEEPLHFWSAPSKESLHLIMLALAIDKNPYAMLFVNADNPSQGPSDAMKLMSLKLDSYYQFYKKYPGYGGYLPWYFHTTTKDIIPANGWEKRVPSLDNGEFIWALFAIRYTLKKKWK